MKIKLDPQLFRPVTIRIENQDELDQLLAIVDNVAENRVSHAPQIIAAAKEMRCAIYNLLNAAEAQED